MKFTNSTPIGAFKSPQEAALLPLKKFTDLASNFFSDVTSLAPLDAKGRAGGTSGAALWGRLGRHDSTGYPRGMSTVALVAREGWAGPGGRRPGDSGLVPLGRRLLDSRVPAC